MQITPAFLWLKVIPNGSNDNDFDLTDWLLQYYPDGH